MPPSPHHTAFCCVLESFALPQPPAVLRELHRALASDWPEHALRLPVFAAAATAAASRSLDENIATPAVSSSTAAFAPTNGAPASASPASDNSSSGAFVNSDAALLPALITLLSEPVQIGCRTCTRRANQGRSHERRAASSKRESAASAAAGAAAAAVVSDAAPGIHQRLRLSLESPALQLHFLQFARRTLFAPAPAPAPSALQPHSRVNGTAAPRLQHDLPAATLSAFVDLVRRFASEIDWRIDEAAALAKSGLEPPPVFLPAGAAAAAASSLAPSTFANYVDPRFEAGGLYVPTPPALVAGRGVDHHPQILAELRTLSKMIQELRTITLPARQERFFKHGDLSFTSNTDAMERLVEQLRSQTLAAALAKTASSAPAASAGAAAPSAAPLPLFQPARQPPWLRFEQTPEEAAIFAAEHDLELARLAKHKRHEAEIVDGEAKSNEDGELPSAKHARTDDGKTNTHDAAAALDAEIMVDEDFILLSQAPRVKTAAAASSAVAAASSSAATSESESLCSTPRADPWQAFPSSPELFPQFLEPEEQYPAWMLDAGEDAAAAAAALEPSLTQTQPEVVAPQKMSLDDAFEAASQGMSKKQRTEEPKQTNGAVMQDEVALAAKSPSPAPGAASPVPFTHADLDTMRTLLLAHCDRPGFDSALTEFLRHSSGAPDPTAILKFLSAQAGLSSLFAPFRDLVALAKRWREDVHSTKEFEEACGHFQLASLSLSAQLMFFAAFLDSSLSSSRVRSLIIQSVGPLLRSWSDARSARPASLVLLLSLLARGHEDALVKAAVAPFLAYIFASPAAQSDENVPAHRLMRELCVPSSIGLSHSARLLLLQHLCMVSLALHERVQARVPLNPLHLGNAALMLFDALLKQLPLPPPSAENFPALLALCAQSSGSGAASSSSSLLARLLPPAASASQSDTVLSSLQLPLGDVSSLLLCVFLLASRNDKLRKQVKLTNVLLPFVKAQAQTQQLKTGQPLHAVAQSLATGFATISKKILDAIK